MNLKRKIKWRIDHILKNGYHAIPLVLPGRIRAFFYGYYSFLGWLAHWDKELKIKKHKEKGYLITFKNFVFLIPKKGFVEIDFLDIIYPKKKLNELKKILSEEALQEEGHYESNKVFLKKNDIVIDAGASVGLFSIYASKKIGNAGKVFSFEPVPEVVNFLSENMSLNNCSNIYIKELALGKTTGVGTFSVNLKKVFEGSSSAINRGGEVRNFPQITVDDFVKKNNLKKIDFIKADIEGSERDLLLGAEKTIKLFKPRISIRTYHFPDDPEVIEEILRRFVWKYKIQKEEKTIYAWV